MPRVQSVRVNGTDATIDRTAAGWGWATMDLRSVVLHELGHRHQRAHVAKLPVEVIAGQADERLLRSIRQDHVVAQHTVLPGAEAFDGIANTFGAETFAGMGSNLLLARPGQGRGPGAPVVTRLFTLDDALPGAPD